MLDIHSPALAKYATPHKYGKPVLEGSGLEGHFDACAVDIPFVFRHQGRFFMLYTGFDGIGYQSAFAASDDLLHWQFYGMALPRLPDQRWDGLSASATWLLREDDLFGGGELKKYDGKYWMAYHSYPGSGYETGPAEIGLAWTDREDLSDWRRLEKPVFSWRDGADWERGGLYKACLIQKEDTFYLYYNAKTADRSWIEQTGIAISKDLLHWDRYEHNPVLKVTPNTWQSTFLSDPFICRDGDQWVNFYFAYDLKHAQDGLALSTDMLNWDKAADPLLPCGEPGEIDATHAHKASLIFYNNALYHFYCAVRPWREGDKSKVHNEYRTISVACSKPLR
jgi:predicted GH43/DUF377 family glycosyl hydrolase